MTHSASMRTGLFSAPPLRWLLLAFWAMTMLVAGSANAGVDLRVSSRPIGDPISTFVTVTNGGLPVTNLTTGNFVVRVDGNPVSTPTISIPTAQGGSAQKVSVVFAMDSSGSMDGFLTPMRNAVISYINAMQPGDRAAVLKFNGEHGVRVDAPFTTIASPNTALINAVNLPYDGTGSNLYDAIVASVAQFTPALPAGPKVIVVISDGGESGPNSGGSAADVNDALLAANAKGISVFSVGIGTFAGAGQTRLTQLATHTSGVFYPAPTEPEIANSYIEIRTLLANEYFFTLPANIISDCNTHTIDVAASSGATAYGSAQETFTRCTPTIVPNLVGLTNSAAITALNDVGRAKPYL